MNNGTQLTAVYISGHKIYREYIHRELAPFNIQILATAESYEKMKPYLKEKNPEFILLEYEFMPDNIHSVIKEIKVEHPGSKIFVVGIWNPLEVAVTYIESGANGYYDQHCQEGCEGLVKAIYNVYNNIEVVIPSPYKREMRPTRNALISL